MQITPKNEIEIAEMGLWPANSICSFEIIENVTFGTTVIQTSDATSKKGNDMIILVVQIYNDTGETKILVDYLLESTAAKLRNAMIACGLLAKYESGHFLASDFIGKKGELRIGIEKDATGQYPDKNKIIGYVTDSTARTNNTYNQTVHPALDDSIPF